jgi:isopenicillin-N N-acyltransferase like protein
MQLPVINCKGDPYSVGYEHGAQAAQQVRANIQRWCRYGRGAPGEREQLAQQLEATLAHRQPAALAEMRGIAEGAAVPYAQVRDLNFSGELWSDTFLDRPARGCTLIGSTGTPHGVVIAKTLDAAPGDEQFLLVQRVRPAEGAPYVHLTWAGTLWTDGGVNDLGLAEVNSTLCARVRNPDGYPAFLMLRELLQQCDRVEAAVDYALAREAVAIGNNLLLGDEKGALAVVERSTTQAAVRWPGSSGSGLTATNHSLAPELASLLGGGPEFLENSRARLARLHHLGDVLPTTLTDWQHLLRDHAGHGSLCQHGQGNLTTVAALIVAPSRREMWVTCGAPCCNPFQLVSWAHCEDGTL